MNAVTLGIIGGFILGALVIAKALIKKDQPRTNRVVQFLFGFIGMSFGLLGVIFSPSELTNSEKDFIGTWEALNAQDNYRIEIQQSGKAHYFGEGTKINGYITFKEGRLRISAIVIPLFNKEYTITEYPTSIVENDSTITYMILDNQKFTRTE